MVLLTKLDGHKFMLNCDLMESIEEKPDTTIRLTTKSYYIVKESMQDVVKKIIIFKRECNGTFGITNTEIIGGDQ